MKCKRLLNAEQEEYLKKIVKGRYSYEIAEMLNIKFDLNLTKKQIAAYKKNHKISSDYGTFQKGNIPFNKGTKGISKPNITSFKKGNIPVNKGTKGLYNVGGNITSFKKGNKPMNSMPIGTEVVTDEGYILIKVNDNYGPHNIAKRWKIKAHIIWEESNGPLPAGSIIIYADGNRSNINLDNLILVSRKELVMLNKKGLYFPSNPEATRCGLSIVKINNKIIERGKQKNEK